MKVVKKVVEVKQITVPVFTEEGSITGTKKIIVKWLCPTCGQKMGSPSKISLVKENTVYTVDLWKNACGHIPKVGELLQLQNKYSKKEFHKVGGHS